MDRELTHIINILSRADIRLSNLDVEVTEYEWEKIRNEWADVGLTLARLKVTIQQKTKTFGDEYKDLETLHIDNFNDAMKVLK